MWISIRRLLSLICAGIVGLLILFLALPGNYYVGMALVWSLWAIAGGCALAIIYLICRWALEKIFFGEISNPNEDIDDDELW